jgi:hypothetical protein
MSSPQITAYPAVGATLEERLHEALDDFLFLADLFDLQAVAPDRGDAPLTGSGTAAAARFCRRASANLREVLDALPVAALNATGRPRRRRRRPNR